jgi:hypothetical protein
MSGSLNSIGIDLQQLFLGSIQIVWASGATPVGALTLEVSNDIVQPSLGTNPAANVVNWTTYSGSSTALSGNSGTAFYNITDMGFRWLRLVYTRTSGSATMNAVFFGKGA